MPVANRKRVEEETVDPAYEIAVAKALDSERQMMIAKNSLASGNRVGLYVATQPSGASRTLHTEYCRCADSKRTFSLEIGDVFRVGEGDRLPPPSAARKIFPEEEIDAVSVEEIAALRECQNAVCVAEREATEANATIAAAEEARTAAARDIATAENLKKMLTAKVERERLAVDEFFSGWDPSRKKRALELAGL
jgi:hypothetical protein